MNYIPPRRSDGTKQTYRVPLPWPKDKPFRILAIDGGGICGILPASVLAELEARYLQGYPTRLFFDQPIMERGANWTQHRVIDRQWWAPSWRDVLESFAWPAMLCAHLRAVQ